jgi:hypothetical protein
MHVNKMQHQLKNIKKIDKDYFGICKRVLEINSDSSIQLNAPPRSKNKTKDKRKA